jgi:hypothetical protein
MNVGPAFSLPSTHLFHPLSTLILGWHLLRMIHCLCLLRAGESQERWSPWRKYETSLNMSHSVILWRRGFAENTTDETKRPFHPVKFNFFIVFDLRTMKLFT